jgi:hypothetical protein
MTVSPARDYGYHDAAPGHAHAYLLPTVDRVLHELKARRVFHLGCGNGSVAGRLFARYEFAGAVASESGFAQTKATFPELKLAVALRG